MKERVDQLKIAIEAAAAARWQRAYCMAVTSTRRAGRQADRQTIEGGSSVGQCVSVCTLFRQRDGTILFHTYHMLLIESSLRALSPDKT